MKALLLQRTVSLDAESEPLVIADIPIPVPGAGEILLRVLACGVCHTELDEIEGRAAPSVLPIVLGHEVVGLIEKLGEGVTSFEIGERLGVGWIHSSSGAPDENLSERFIATGRDVNGGYAEYMTVPEAYAYRIPSVFSDAEAAPLLCAGAVGYRALKLSSLRNGERLGLMGFGGSAHLVLQLARHLFPQSEVFVFARDPSTRDFALRLGATWAGDVTQRSPHRLDAIIDTTPAWKPIVEALANLRAGGRLIINAIRKEDSDKEYLLNISYHHHLWMERQVQSVANVTANDIAEFLKVAAEVPIKPEIQTYRFEDANQALLELKQGRIRGAKVLVF